METVNVEKVEVPEIFQTWIDGFDDINIHLKVAHALGEIAMQGWGYLVKDSSDSRGQLTSKEMSKLDGFISKHKTELLHALGKWNDEGYTIELPTKYYVPLSPEDSNEETIYLDRECGWVSVEDVTELDSDNQFTMSELEENYSKYKHLAKEVD